MATTAERLQDELYSEAVTVLNNHPTYLAEPSVLGRYGQRALEVLKSHDAEVMPLIRRLSLETNNAEPYDRNLSVVIGDTPTRYGTRLVGFVRKGVFILPVLEKVPVGKVFGVYDRNENTLTVHYGLFPEFANDDPERTMLESRGIEYPSPAEVMTHERAHRVQDEGGALHKYERRDAIEGLATLATEYLLGKRQKVYQAAQVYAKNLINLFGFRNAFRGDVPDNYRTPPIQPQPVPA